MDFWSINEEQLKMCVYHDLEIFEINHYELKKAFIIIENSGEHLKIILFRSSYDIDEYIKTLMTILSFIFIHTNDEILEE
ncbi:hypothetical protein RIR_jg41787.t1 [Rhizophagus irregularis DAOM 181602=DAOM 197198]|nr:hypothetical protein RIR_jg41787.t1 [Rhizophagus irregularis DAOM 181602=DAOM 197198]